MTATIASRFVKEDNPLRSSGEDVGFVDVLKEVREPAHALGDGKHSAIHDKYVLHGEAWNTSEVLEHDGVFDVEALAQD